MMDRDEIMQACADAIRNAFSTVQDVTFQGNRLVVTDEPSQDFFQKWTVDFQPV